MSPLYFFLGLFALSFGLNAQAPTNFDCSPLALPNCAGPYVCNPNGFAYYWRGGYDANGNFIGGANGDFNQPCNWGIDSINGPVPIQGPQTSNDVYFQAAAFSAPSSITFSGSANCRNMYWDNLIDPNHRVQVSSPSGASLTVNGSLDLADDLRLDFYFQGNLSLTAQAQVPNDVYYLRTRGQRLRLTRLGFEAEDFAGNTCTYELWDDLWVDDPIQSNSNNSGGFIELIRGGLKSNGHRIRTDRFISFSNNNTRRLNMEQSYVLVAGRNSGSANVGGSASWGIDFDGSNGSFLASGSHLYVAQNNGNPSEAGSIIRFGTVQYDSISIATALNAVQASNTVRGGSPSIRHLYILEPVTLGSCTLLVDTCYFREGVEVHFSSPDNLQPILRMDTAVIINDDFCSLVFLLNNGARPRIGKKTPGGQLNIHGFVLQGVEFVSHGGSNAMAHHSIPIARLINMAFTPYGCDCRQMRFVDNTNTQDWQNLGNWQVLNGGSWIPATRLPFICDDVEFADNSFPHPNRFVRLVGRGYCRNFVWQPTAPTDSEFRLARSISALNVYGDFLLDTEGMRDTVFSYNSIIQSVSFPTPYASVFRFDSPLTSQNMVQAQIDFWGGYDYLTDTDTLCRIGVTSANTNRGVHILPTLLINEYARYQIVDTLAGRHYSAASSSFTMANNVGIDLSALRLGGRHLHNARVRLRASGEYAFRDEGGVDTVSAAQPVYSGHTTFTFAPDTLGTILSSPRNGLPRFYYGFNYALTSTRGFVDLPNSIFKGPVLEAEQHVFVHGNLRLEHNAAWHSSLGISAALFVTGWMQNVGSPYFGDMYLSSGRNYVLTSGLTGSNLRVARNLYALGSCDSLINISTSSGGSTPVFIGGTAFINYASISGWNNTGNPLIIANNGIDAGVNDNISFLSQAGQIFYWRAKQGLLTSDPDAFSGAWTDNRHWTTNPASLYGSGACLPTLLDTVVFDDLSGPASDTCYIELQANCAMFWYKSNAGLSLAGLRQGSNIVRGSGMLQIAQALEIERNATDAFSEFTGDYRFVANSEASSLFKPLRFSGTILSPRHLEFTDLRAGVIYDLQDSLSLVHTFNVNGTTILGRNGAVFLNGGTLRTNGHSLRLPTQLVMRNVLSPGVFRHLEAGNSQIYMACIGENYLGSGVSNALNPWWVDMPSSLATNALITMSSGGAIHFLNPSIPMAQRFRKQYYMGTNPNSIYNDVFFYQEAEPNANPVLHGVASYRNLSFLGSSDFNIQQSNTVDTLRLNGGVTYAFQDNSTQTFRSPHGTLICNSSATAFTSIRTFPTGSSQKSRFFKAFGEPICVDFVRVENNRAGRDEALCLANNTPNLYFFAGDNSDNVNLSATTNVGVDTFWNFSLGTAAHATVASHISSCVLGGTDTVRLAISGADLGGYKIVQQWHDLANNPIGLPQTTIVQDDDNNGATPFYHNTPIVLTQAGYYSFRVTVLRCGSETPAILDTAYVYLPDPNILVSVNSQGSCVLDNSPIYVDFFDQIQQRPIASIQDGLGAGDNQALGLTQVQVRFDPSITNCDGGSMGIGRRLPRHWQIDPTVNDRARVRLYFTQAELLQLGLTTTLGTNITVGDLELWKFPSGQGCTGIDPTVLPFTVVDWTASTAGLPNDKAFTSTAGVWGIEFEVNSFSDFFLVISDPIILSSDLLSFEAQLNSLEQAELSWAVAQNGDKAKFYLERSPDARQWETIQSLDALPQAGHAAYQSLDSRPLQGWNYYRLRIYNQAGQRSYSSVRALSLEGAAQHINLYPNPNPGQFFLELRGSSAQNLNLEVIDALGRVVWQAHKTLNGAVQALNLPPSLPSGVYYLRLQTDEGQTYQRSFILMRD